MSDEEVGESSLQDSVQTNEELGKSNNSTPVIEDGNAIKGYTEVPSDEKMGKTEPHALPSESKQEHEPESKADENANFQITDMEEEQQAKAASKKDEVPCEMKLDEAGLLVAIKKEILVTQDTDRLRQLTERLRYRTTSKRCSTFQEYIKAMQRGQKDIYFMIGSNYQHLSTSLFVRRVVRGGFEVLLMADPILDDRVVKRLCRRYNQFRLVAVDTENLALPLLGQEEVLQKRKRHAEALKEFLPLCKRFKSMFPDKIQKIVISDTLVRKSFAIVDCNGGSEAKDVEPCYEINMGTGRLRLEINPDSHSLRSLCLRAALLDKKQEQLDSLIKFLVPIDEKPL